MSLNNLPDAKRNPASLLSPIMKGSNNGSSVRSNASSGIGEAPSELALSVRSNSGSNNGSNASSIGEQSNLESNNGSNNGSSVRSNASSEIGEAPSELHENLEGVNGSNNKINVSKMNINQMKQYILENGEDITSLALKKAKDNFFNNSTGLNHENVERAKEKATIDSLTTISAVQEFRRKLDEDLKRAEQEIINAPERSTNPNNGPRLKGAKIQNRNALKTYIDRLKPVLQVLESTIQASNTLSTIKPLSNSYEKLKGAKGENNSETKRQSIVSKTAYTQYAKEVKDAVDSALAIKGIEHDAELEVHQENLSKIVDALEKDVANTTKPLLKNGSLVNNRVDRPIDVTVPIKDNEGRISYSSYRMDKGNFSKLDNPIQDNKAVEDKFKEAVRSAKTGTKVVKMTYKDEPLIISMNISRPNESVEKAEINMESALQKEKQQLAPAVTTNNGMERPGRPQNMDLSSLSMNELESAKQKIEKNIAFVNENTKVLPQNKETLKKAIRESLMPIQTAIEMKRRQKGGKTAKKSKKNNKTKKSTRRSS